MTSAIDKNAKALLTEKGESAILSTVGSRERGAITVKKGAKVAGYIRVSTLTQAEHGHGLAEQAETIREFCGANGYELVAVYEDAGVSGANGIEGREALPQLLADLEAGDFEGVVITRLDRLARDLMLQENILADVRKRAGELLSIAEPDLCSEDNTRTLIRQIMGAVAEYEKKLIVARLAGGRKRKVKEGGYSGGWLPVGYTVQGEGRDAEVGVDPKGTAIVRRVFSEYAGGASMREVAEGLQADGVPTQRGGTWAQATVGVIIGNLFYTGRDEVDGEVRRNGHPAIIDERLFQRCERRRKKARRR